jgi:two-component system alkaline phosphatase synthesis response regulator PhoP
VDVLIADDEPFVIRSLSYVFHREGFSFDTAADGEEALAKAQKLRPKILFLDIMMPKKTGVDVCMRLKSDPQLRTIHIIMLTAKGQEEDRIKSISAGADGYITKPFSPKSVITHVRELLGRIS